MIESGRIELEGCRGSVGDGKPGTGRKEEEDRSEKTEKTSWRKKRGGGRRGLFRAVGEVRKKKMKEIRED